MTILEQLETNKESLIAEQKKYDTKSIASEIAILENELNRKVNVRNNTLEIYNDFEGQINRIDQTIRAINELTA